MADGTPIEWTDATWNVVTGCSVVSPGCANCYAMRLAGTRLRNHPSRAGLTVDSKAGPVWNGQVRFNDAVLADPLKWQRPRRIFVCAHGDLFHDAVPDAWIDQVVAVMARAQQHHFQVLTKRAERMRAYFTALPARIRDWACDSGLDFVDLPLPNVWLGVSVEDQARADERIPLLLDTPAAVRWLSCEPLLGPVDLQSVKAPRYPEEPEDELNIDWRFDALTTGDYYWFDGEHGQPGDCGDGPYREQRIDWVVAGGESGPGARPMHPDWARSLRDQCARAALHGDDAPVPFLFKQWGNWKPLKADDGYWPTDNGHCRRLLPDGRCGAEGWPFQRISKGAAGRLLDGVQHDGFPSSGMPGACRAQESEQ